MSVLFPGDVSDGDAVVNTNTSQAFYAPNILWFQDLKHDFHSFTFSQNILGF